jgi:hypothetical protein
MEDRNDTVYKASIFEIISNYLFVIILMIAVLIFKERNLKKVVIGIVYISIICFLDALFSKFLLTVKFNRGLSEVEFNIRGYMFLRQRLTFKSDKVYFTYKDEITGRGAKNKVLTFYDSEKNKIIRVFNGFSEYDSYQMILTCESMSVKEILN